MANSFDTGPAPTAAIARRRVVASYTSYDDAVRAVDALSDRGLPVERVSIVGHGLRLVERVTGRIGYPQAALDGAISGAIVGGLLGLLLGLFDADVTGLGLFVWGVMLGAVAGAIVGLLFHAIRGGRRDFASVGRLEADRYEVVADEDVADDARRVLEEVGASAATR